MLDKHVKLFEATLVEQHIDAFACGILPFSCCLAMAFSPPPVWPGRENRSALLLSTVVYSLYRGLKF